MQKILSKLHDEIISVYKTTVLVSGSSEYFNKLLYPLINDIERLLRKLLYLKATLSSNEKGATNIKNLEEFDFGNLFEMLFTDEEFIKNLKKQVNQASYKYTKDDIINQISALNENVLWDVLVGKDKIPTLKSNFVKVRLFRNDIMHAHNINYQTYKESKNLFVKIINELNDEINKINGSESSSDYNEQLATAIDAIKVGKNLIEIISASNPEWHITYQDQIKNAKNIAINSISKESLEQIRKTIDDVLSKDGKLKMNDLNQ